jgi:hypothetical protein
MFMKQSSFIPQKAILAGTVDAIGVVEIINDLIGEESRNSKNRRVISKITKKYIAKVLNVKILMILPKLCIGIGDTKFEQLMTLFSIDNGLYPGKTQRL